MKELYDLIVIGGGASGFFGALTCKQIAPHAKVAIIEMHSKFLSKVRISGGGRCNLTHHCYEPKQLIKNYPRGGKELLSVFERFQPLDTLKWFEERGVKTKVEVDGRIFPSSNTSQTIIDCLLDESQKLGVELLDSVKVESIEKEDQYILKTNRQTFKTNNILLACGGYTHAGGFKFLDSFALDIIQPVPSLFSFHIADKTLQQLSGISVSKATVKIAGKKPEYEGPLLITHQGMSGPAILKTSAFAARDLNEMNYQFNISVNWANETEQIIRATMETYKNENRNQKIGNAKLFLLPQRLWHYLIEKATIDNELKWVELPLKKLNKLVEVVFHDQYAVNGKSPNKEEFVTAGGINLKTVDFKTMQIKNHEGLYASGEIIDIDGITGGFNFQAAWSTGYIAGMAIGQKLTQEN